MTKYIKLPAPQLSQLKEVSIDLDMTGRHYALLASCEGQLPEDVATSILNDLMEQDAYKLTLAEVRYLFTLVKINSLENDYTVSLECPHKKADGTECGCINTYTVSLSDGELHPTPSDYVPPTIEFNTKDGPRTFSVIPPSIKEESALYEYFLTQKDANQEKISEDKTLSFEFTFLRGILHLVESDGSRFKKETDFLGDMLGLLDCNKFQTINKLYDLVIEVNQYGVQNKIYTMKCKECGGMLSFHLPLLSGLTE